MELEAENWPLCSTYTCTCPVGSTRRCGLLILSWQRYNPVRCCELLILQGAHTLHTWNPVGQKSGARAFDWRACCRERGHSYRSISSYMKLPPPACPGTTCSRYMRNHRSRLKAIFASCIMLRVFGVVVSSVGQIHLCQLWTKEVPCTFCQVHLVPASHSPAPVKLADL